MVLSWACTQCVNVLIGALLLGDASVILESVVLVLMLNLEIHVFLNGRHV